NWPETVWPETVWLENCFDVEQKWLELPQYSLFRSRQRELGVAIWHAERQTMKAYEIWISGSRYYPHADNTFISKLWCKKPSSDFREFQAKSSLKLLEIAVPAYDSIRNKFKEQMPCIIAT
ncbi:MAG: hypothetical protein KDB03_28005, partial [Planctomycetales bacterium]|nr:hypothetical protein [Planctomycetales bacterium]